MPERPRLRICEMAERKTFLVRMDPALHQYLASWAAQEKRSLNAHIELLLRRALANGVPATTRQTCLHEGQDEASIASSSLVSVPSQTARTKRKEPATDRGDRLNANGRSGLRSC